MSWSVKAWPMRRGNDDHISARKPKLYCSARICAAPGRLITSAPSRELVNISSSLDRNRTPSVSAGAPNQSSHTLPRTADSSCRRSTRWADGLMEQQNRASA